KVKPSANLVSPAKTCYYGSAMKTALLLLSLVLLVFLSFGRILTLFFGSDDFVAFHDFAINRHIYDLLYFFDAPRLWPLFHIFRLSPMGYYAVALLFFALATLLVFAVSRAIWKRTAVAWFAAAVFGLIATGDVALYTASESIRISQYLTLQLTTILLYLRFLRKNTRKRFGLALALFAITTLIFPYRAHVMIVLMILLEWSQGARIRLKTSVQRLLPFLAATILIYSVAVPLLAASTPGQIGSLASIPNRWLSLITNWLPLLMRATATVFFLFLPSLTTGARMSPAIATPGMFHMAWLAVFAGFLIILQPKGKRILFFLLAGIGVIVAGYSVVYVDYATPTHRYYMMVRPFLAMLIAGVAAEALRAVKTAGMAKKAAGALVLLFLSATLVSNIFHHVRVQEQVLFNRGPFANTAIRTITAAIPTLNKFTIIFVDGRTERDRRQFMAMFENAGTPGWVLAPYYRVGPEGTEVIDAYHCDLFGKLLSEHRGNVDVYYFFAANGRVQQAKSANAARRCQRPGLF
ncbi:MAG: hypothetical protein AAB803_02250, partial [Patescibacteria group bacterium]